MIKRTHVNAHSTSVKESEPLYLLGNNNSYQVQLNIHPDILCA